MLLLRFAPTHVAESFAATRFAAAGRTSGATPIPGARALLDRIAATR
ncbi:hypothetical protein [Saccharopolyspora spinosa]